MHTIMVPLDGSPTAETVMPYVLPLAVRLGARLILVAVHEPDVPSRGATGVPAVDRRVDDEARAAMGSYLGDLARRLASQGLSVDTVVLQGAPAERLAWYAETAGVDLLAIATHGRGGVTRLWLGSVADRVLRHVDVPVFVIHARKAAGDAATHAAIRRVLVPLDGRLESEAIRGPLIEFTQGDAVDYILLRVVNTSHSFARATPTGDGMGRDLKVMRRDAVEYLAHVAAQLEPEVGTVGTLVRTARDPARQILSTAAELGADLIALTTHGAGVVGRALMGSVADKVMRGARVPVLLKRVAYPAAQPSIGTDPSGENRIRRWTVQRW